jgi:hypothetical protein
VLYCGEEQTLLAGVDTRDIAVLSREWFQRVGRSGTVIC